MYNAVRVAVHHITKSHNNVHNAVRVAVHHITKSHNNVHNAERVAVHHINQLHNNVHNVVHVAVLNIYLFPLSFLFILLFRSFFRIIPYMLNVLFITNLLWYACNM